MTTASLDSTARSARVVDIAGTAWPLYKLEALAAGLIVFLIAAVVVQTLQIAVLSAAATAVIAWVVGLSRQAAGSE